MGTSASSNGPKSGISLDPPWLDDIDMDKNPFENNNQDKEEIFDDIQQNAVQQLQILAPRARFSSARRNLSDYVRSGSTDSLRQSLGHYSRTGMGGASAVSRRMRVSARVGANFFDTFRSLRDDAEFALGKTLSSLKSQGADAHQIISAIVNHACPQGGSLDEISSKNSATAALSEYLEKYPDTDIFHLSDDQMWALTGTYLGNEIFSRIQMDVGQAFENSAIPLPDRIKRLNEMKEFIQVEVSNQLNKIRDTASQIVNTQKLLQETIKTTFEIYEVAV